MLDGQTSHTTIRNLPCRRDTRSRPVELACEIGCKREPSCPFIQFEATYINFATRKLLYKTKLKLFWWKVDYSRHHRCTPNHRILFDFYAGVLISLDVLGESLPGHSYDNVGGCPTGTLLPFNWASSLVGMMVTPQHQIHFVFLETERERWRKLSVKRSGRRRKRKMQDSSRYMSRTKVVWDKGNKERIECTCKSSNVLNGYNLQQELAPHIVEATWQL